MWKDGKAMWSILVVVCIMLATSPAMAKDKTGDVKKAAVVNGTIIPEEELTGEINQIKQRAQQQGKVVSDTQLAKMRKDILERMIDYELLYQESQKKGIVVSDQDVSDDFQKLKKRFPSEEQFQKTMQTMNISETKLKGKIMRGIAIRKLIGEDVEQKITISEKETKTFYDGNPEYFKEPEKVRDSHILVKVDAKASDADKAEARKKINDIQEKLKKGQDFAALAKEYSDCPSSASGGDLNFFGRGQMVKPFEEVAFALKPGTISDIVETPFGYHLIKVTDKQPAKTIAYAEAKERITMQLKQTKTREGVAHYIENLKKTAKIETF